MSWNKISLGNFVTLKRGYDLPNSHRHKGDVPIVSSSGITGYHNEAKVNGPGVVTGRYGTLGQVFFIEEDFWPLNTALYVQDFKGNVQRFVAYFLKNILRGMLSDKAAVPGVNRNDLHARKVLVTIDLGIQKRIADILSTYDDLIENNKRRIALLEQATRLLYKEWFVNLHFPDHEHIKITDGVPYGWSKCCLNEVAKVNGKSLSKSHEGKIEYIDISSVAQGQINETNVYNFKDAPSRARRVLKHGDIIWSCVRPNRKSYAIIWNPADNLIASTGFAVITPKMVPTSYLYQALTTEGFVGYLTNNARGAAYPAVTASDFEKASIMLPHSNLIRQFNDIVEPTLIQIHILQQISAKLIRARNLLLPRLLNGEISV